MFSNHFSSSSPFILKFLYVGKIKLRQREFYSKDKRSNQVSIFKQPLDFLDGSLHGDAQNQLHAATRGSLKSPVTADSAF